MPAPNDGFILLKLEGCGYCQALQPAWKQITREIPELVFVEVECSDYPGNRLARFLGVTAFPTIVPILNGKPVPSQKIVGQRDIDELREHSCRYHNKACDKKTRL